MYFLFQYILKNNICSLIFSSSMLSIIYFPIVLIALKKSVLAFITVLVIYCGGIHLGTELRNCCRSRNF